MDSPGVRLRGYGKYVTGYAVSPIQMQGLSLYWEYITNGLTSSRATMPTDVSHCQKDRVQNSFLETVGAEKRWVGRGRRAGGSRQKKNKIWGKKKKRWWEQIR